jgi:nitrogen regulatory protein P-II 1
MKLITAIIQPDKLDEVREALIAAGVGRITVSRVSGHGQATGEEFYRGQKVVPSLFSKVRIEIACADEHVKTVCDTILRAAKHEGGKIGDGKIFVTPLDDIIRIRTGEQGAKAI